MSENCIHPGLKLVDRIVANCESISHFAKEEQLRLATFANLYRVYFFISEIMSVLFPITAFLRTNNSHFFGQNLTQLVRFPSPVGDRQRSR